jgi:hypothetical protein
MILPVVEVLASKYLAGFFVFELPLLLLALSRLFSLSSPPPSTAISSRSPTETLTPLRIPEKSIEMKERQ